MIQTMTTILFMFAFVIGHLRYRSLSKANDKLMKASKENMEANQKYMEAVEENNKAQEKIVQALKWRCRFYEKQLFGKEETV